MSRLGSLAGRIGSGLAPIALLLAAWQALSWAGAIDSTTLPAPAATLAALARLLEGRGFFVDLGITVLRGLGGLALGAAVGIPLGLLMAVDRRAEGFFNPLVKATYSLPKTALVPLFILWFGIGSVTNVLAVALSTVLPIIIYTYHGVQSAPKILIWSARAMGTTERRLLWDVLLPAAQHGILTGLRIGLGFAFLIAIAAEMIAAQLGIGKLLFMYGETGAYDFMFAAVTAIVLAAYAADRALVAVSDHLLRWQEPAHGRTGS
ncbi:MAG: hypothetical protein JWR08_889 [Enterovirga sp.]|nr:hypothetical protein [Enterovirga sp.]